MTATARFSKQFYERFGEDVANELILWLEGQFRMHTERLEARLEARIDERFNQFRLEMRAEAATLRTELATLRAELIKWSFVFFATAALAVIGLR